MAKLTAARLRELLDYDPATGQFAWRVNRRGRFARIGQRAGSPRKDGRLQICIDERIYFASRLAVLWMTGEWPRQLVDHRNCNPADDRWTNLREATFSQNGANSRARQSAIPLKGVTRSRNGRYDAQIKVNYQRICLGRFKTAKAANAAYAAAARLHFGEFARR
jgi:hypothetical protein